MSFQLPPSPKPRTTTPLRSRKMIEASVVRLVSCITTSRRRPTMTASGVGGPEGRAGGRAGSIGVEPRSMVAASGWYQPGASRCAAVGAVRREPGHNASAVADRAAVCATSSASVWRTRVFS